MPVRTALTPGLAFAGPPVLEHWHHHMRLLTHRHLDLYATTAGRLADAYVDATRAANLPALLELAERHAALWRGCADAHVALIRGFLDG